MDWIACKDLAQEYLKKYKYILFLFLLGILLVALPDQKKDTVAVPETFEEAEDLQESLAKILSGVSGAGKVDVLLSEARGEQMVYQLDEDRSVGKEESDIRTDTVLVTDAGRNETGLIKQVNAPVYQGAIILCQGADNASVRLSIVQAVKSITGLTSDKITVLKMK